MERFCPNCSTSLRETDRYCPSCGQKDAPARVTVRQLIGDLLGNVFAWDNRFFRSVRQLARPASLTVLFFEGKQERYIPPVRLYFFTVLLHLAVINFFSTNSLFKISDADRTTGKELVRLEGEMSAIRSVRDSMAAIADLDPVAVQVLDSSYTRLENQFNEVNDTITLILFGEETVLEFTLYELETLSLDSLAARNKDADWFGSVASTQFIKTYRNPRALTSFIVARLSWMMFLIIPFIALVLAGLYFPKRQYYVEHLVFTLHYHVAAYLLVSIGIIMDYFIGGSWTGLTFVLSLAYVLIALKHFYRQSWGMTIFKFCVLHVLYLVIFLVLAALLMITSFLLFA